MCLGCHIYRLLNGRRTFHMCPVCHTCLGLAAHIPMRVVMHIPISDLDHFPLQCLAHILIYVLARFPMHVLVYILMYIPVHDLIHTLTHIPIYVPAHFPVHFPVLPSLLPEVLAHILLILSTPDHSSPVHSSSFLRLNALNSPFFQAAAGRIRFPAWRQRNLMYRPDSRSSLPGYLPENHSGFRSLPHYTSSLPGQHHTALQP